ncbi:MAG: acyl--CoA ligase [Halioglobus sp.]|nr:acyl--CoA ligase [Halioglobus sp.]
MLEFSDDIIERYTTAGLWGTETFSDRIAHYAQHAPQGVALVDAPNRHEITGDQPRRLTFAELDRRCVRIAALFLSCGIGKGDIVVVQLPNITELVEIILACARIGAIVSPVAVQFGTREIADILDLTQARLFIGAERIKKRNLADSAIPVCQRFSCRLLLVGDSGRYPELAFNTQMELSQSNQLLSAYLEREVISANDVATLCWTSGTTGAPKGVPRSHNLWLASGKAKNFIPGENLLSGFPFINAATIGGVLSPWLLTGGKLVLHHPLDIPLFLQQIQDENIDVTTAPPPLLARILEDEISCAALKASNLRMISSGSAPLAPAMVARYQRDLGIVIVNNFGSNEGVFLSSDGDTVPDPVKRAQLFPRLGADNVEWDTPAARFIKTKLVDPATGETITAAHVPGELAVKGPTIFTGYFKRPELTATAFDSEGYFLTGDRFEIAGSSEDARFYRFLGRYKDLIIRGGMNISPEEIDHLLMQHPDIREAAVAGYPDADLGERVGAVIVCEAGRQVNLADLQRFFRQLGVAVFKTPEKLLIIDELPRNSLNKVVRNQLRDLLLEARD